ncbi:hypothetical protein ACI2L1_04605 [Streptomyces sp. NPDC019531]|uniref:hypothetical protein n=1 Tax=Streptomyces sp. NPDC019531 TaxID=3365062 RepID=UPI00384DEFF0
MVRGTIVEAFTGRVKADVAKVRPAEVRSHLSDTCVTWVGGTDDGGVGRGRLPGHGAAGRRVGREPG